MSRNISAHYWPSAASCLCWLVFTLLASLAKLKDRGRIFKFELGLLEPLFKRFLSATTTRGIGRTNLAPVDKPVA